MDAEGFIGIRSLRYLGTPVFFFSLASSLWLREFEPSETVPISSCDMVALSQREPNFVESGLGPGNLPFEMKLFTLWLCNSLSSMLTVPSSGEWSVIWVEQHRPHYLLKSWPWSLTRTCCVGWGGCFHCSLLSPFREQSNVLFDVRVYGCL